MNSSESRIADWIYWTFMGGVAFWLPYVFMYGVFEERLSWLWSNVALLFGLTLFCLISWLLKDPVLKWFWILAGVYILGPIAMLTASAVAGHHVSYWLLLFCLFPPVTLWWSMLSGTIFAVLIVTLVLGGIGVVELILRLVQNPQK